MKKISMLVIASQLIFLHSMAANANNDEWITESGRITIMYREERIIESLKDAKLGQINVLNKENAGGLDDYHRFTWKSDSYPRIGVIFFWNEELMGSGVNGLAKALEKVSSLKEGSMLAIQKNPACDPESYTGQKPGPMFPFRKKFVKEFLRECEKKRVLVFELVSRDEVQAFTAEGRRSHLGRCDFFFEDPEVEITQNKHILLLKSYVPENVFIKEPWLYYCYFGSRNLWRLPLVFPYSILTRDTLDLGELHDESKMKDFSDMVEGNGRKSLGIKGITHLDIDKNYLILRIQNSEGVNSGKRMVKFIIFNFNTKEIMTFDSESDMIKKAEDIGFKKDPELITLREYYDLFFST